MFTDKHCGAENKYRNIKDHNNKFPTSNDMLLFFHLFYQPPSISATFYNFIHIILSARWKIAKVSGKLCICFAFVFLEENCLIKLSWL